VLWATVVISLVLGFPHHHDNVGLSPGLILMLIWAIREWKLKLELVCTVTRVITPFQRQKGGGSWERHRFFFFMLPLVLSCTEIYECRDKLYPRPSPVPLSSFLHLKFRVLLQPFCTETCILVGALSWWKILFSNFQDIFRCIWFVSDVHWSPYFIQTPFTFHHPLLIVIS
jgi:hypothetical protein